MQSSQYEILSANVASAPPPPPPPPPLLFLSSSSLFLFILSFAFVSVIFGLIRRKKSYLLGLLNQMAAISVGSFSIKSARYICLT